VGVVWFDMVAAKTVNQENSSFASDEQQVLNSGLLVIDGF